MKAGSGRDSIEEQVREACSIEAPWALVERFCTLVRLGGSDPERDAVAYVMAELDRFGFSHELHTPVRYISRQLGATLRTLGDEPLIAHPKTVSFSVSVGSEERQGELVYLATGYAEDATALFDLGKVGDVGVRGKVVITEGTPIETKAPRSRGAGRSPPSSPDRGRGTTRGSAATSGARPTWSRSTATPRSRCWPSTSRTGRR
jgi:hypothetical protein